MRMQQNQIKEVYINGIIKKAYGVVGGYQHEIDFIIKVYDKASQTRSGYL